MIAAEGCDPDDKACAAALRTLTDQARAIRHRRKPTGDMNIMPASVFMETRWPNYQERLIADPLLEAMNGAVREIGKYLFENGGLDRMERVAEMAAGPRSAFYSWRGSYIDHRWDGIGNDKGGRWHS